MDRPKLEDWRAENVRYTFFYESDVPDSLKNGLWQEITSSLPESSTNRPLEGVRLDEGPFMNVRLGVAVGVARIDVMLVAPPSAVDFPSIGSLPDVAHEFREVVAKQEKLWNSKPVRCAYGLVTTLPCDNKNAAYAALDSLLKKVDVNPDGRDFLYQINNPKNSAIDDSVIINRLSRWNSLLMKKITVGTSVQVLPIEAYVARVELDFNTAQETPIKGNGTYMDELLDESLRTIANGEC